MKKILMFFLFAAFFADARAALTPVYPAVLNAGSREKAFASLELFFKTYDTAILKRLKKPVIITDEPARLSDPDIIYMQAKNAQLMPLLTAINPVAYSPAEMSVTDEMLVYAGVFELYNELQVRGNKQVSGRAGFPWGCIRDVIVSAFNISTIIIEFQTMIGGGATWATVRPFLWQTLRRYGGWFTVAGVIWDIATECF